MNNIAEQLQVLYEIAMSIGKSLELEDMLKNALSTYLRKLNCTAGIIYRRQKLPTNNYNNEIIFSLPTTLDSIKKFPELSEIIPDHLSKSQNEKKLKSLPEIFETESKFILHIMRLGEFGYLVLVKSKERIHEDILNQLKEINEKLGNACISCLNNESLKESEKKYRDLSELLPGMVCETDINGFVTFVNKYAFKKLEYDNSDLENGFHISRIFAPEDQERAKNNFTRSLVEESMPHREYDIVKKNGEKFQALLYSNQLISGGKVKGIRGVMIDITQRKENEDKLKQYAERLELALIASDAGLWDWNVATGKLVLNDKWYETRKLKTKEISENINSWERLIHPDDKLKTLSAVRDHIAGKTPFYQVEYRTQTGTGKYIWVFDTGKVTEYNRTGSPSRMVGTSIDITTKKENELILQQNYIQQELLSEIALNLNSLDEFEVRINTVLHKVGQHLNVSRVYIFEDNNAGTTTSNTFEWCNENISPQIDELQDIPYEEAIPSWKKILNNEGRIYSENIKELPEDLVAILEPQEIKSILVYPLRVKGKFFGFIGFDECIHSKHWLKSELELLRTISGIIANAYERKISEESLKDSELANRAIIAALPDMLFQFNKEGRLLNYNFLQSHITIFSEVRINKSIHRIFPKHLSKKLLLAIEKCIEEEQYNFEFELPLENNHVYFEVRASKINNEQVLVLMRDITKSKQYESKLTVEKNKAEQANQAKSEFLANMSHEIRTPMNAILGFSEALYNKTVHPQHKETLQSIVNSGNLLLSLLNDILDLSKIEAGKLDITPQPVDLATLLNEIIILFSDKAEKKEVNLELNIDSDFPSTIVIDEIRIKQIIFNIVGNAIKFTKNGYVKIDTRFEHFKNNKGELIISVEDSGIGISESQQERIFDAFIQQSGQSNREFEGVGLGLSICKRLIEKMEGSITVKSTVGKGSVFKISIPNTTVFEGAIITQKVSEEDIVFNDATVLVVDDVISNIHMMKYLLSGWGLKFLSAENGAEAIEILKSKIPDAILLDIRMPVMDGFEVAKHVKNNPSTKNIPIIACTANVSNKIQNNYKENFDGLIFKPIKPKELKEILKKNLEYKTLPKQQRLRKNKTPDLNDIKPEMLAKLPEIASILTKEFLPKWEKISGSLILFQIEEFANELKQAMQPFKCGFINAYTNEIFDDIGNIRLESLKNNLKSFPDIIEQIKNKIQS